MESYHGLILTARDALILIEAARTGKISMVKRRLSKDERLQAVESGAIFVWEESINGIQRWTDGKSWTSSRVVGKFLAYNERDSNEKVRLSLLKKDELVKLIFALTLKDGNKFHVISYCSLAYFRNLHTTPPGFSKLIRPSEDSSFQHIQFSEELYEASSLENIDQISFFYNGELVDDSSSELNNLQHDSSKIDWNSLDMVAGPQSRSNSPKLDTPYQDPEVAKPALRSFSYPLTEFHQDSTTTYENDYNTVYGDNNITLYVDYLQHAHQNPTAYPQIKFQPVIDSRPPLAVSTSSPHINSKQDSSFNPSLPPEPLLHFNNYNENGMFDPHRSHHHLQSHNFQHYEINVPVDPHQVDPHQLDQYHDPHLIHQHHHQLQEPFEEFNNLPAYLPHDLPLLELQQNEHKNGQSLAGEQDTFPHHSYPPPHTELLGHPQQVNSQLQQQYIQPQGHIPNSQFIN